MLHKVGLPFGMPARPCKVGSHAGNIHCEAQKEWTPSTEVIPNNL